MAKMSGRGLGLTGGTIDKVESIPGFRVDLPENEFFEQVRTHGFALCAQTKNLTPLDKVIYELRDVTGTTESIPSIASSIMSKKLAAGATNVLIDIKVGSGALIKTEEEAKQLSKWVIAIGEAYKRNVKTVISGMDTPLSNATGNALEIAEVINVLHGKDCPLLRKSIELTSILLSMATGIPIEEAKVRATDVVTSGEALKKFYEFVKLQGGRLAELDLSKIVIPVKAKKSGKVTKIDALGVAKLAAKVGASKDSLEDELHYGAGITLSVREGDLVKKDDLLFNIYCDEVPELDEKHFDFIEIKEV
jgi:pyrimidine-nucleoside phosphorylase